MPRVLLHNALLLDPEAAAPETGALLLRDERIEARLRPGEKGPEDALRVDLGGHGLAPGFVDLHFHGSLVFADESGLASALAADSRSLARHGTTAFLPTSVAWSATELRARVARLAALVAQADHPGARPLGLHLEGPWINPAAAGAQPGAAIRAFDPREGEDVLARAEGRVRMVTLAPEAEGAAALQQLLARRGVVAALGHSLATAEESERAVARGARHVTHLFNAMGPLEKRSPGLAGVALADDRLTCDLICDGSHVHPAVVRLSARAKGERLVLITDRVDPPAAAASFGSGALRSDGVALRLPDGRLAGSCLTLDLAQRNLRAFAGLSALAAVACCTLHPARVIGVEAERGTLRAQARADLVVLDAEGRVRETWIGGRRVYTSA